MKFLVLTAAGAAVLGVATSAAPAPAFAGCHLIDCLEDVYVKPAELRSQTCESLWVLRNSIYKDAGYCFQTSRAKAWFTNQSCRHTNIESVPLNDYQRHNVRVLKAAENTKGC